MYELHVHPEPEDPVLVVVLEGWVDAGGAARAAVDQIAGRSDRRNVATFDTDRLLDHRARRPVMRLQDGILTELAWPTIEVVLVRDDEGRDVLVLHGAEPDHEWGAFIDAVLEICEDLGVTMVVGLGAYPAAAPHTRPARLACTASTPELATRLSFERATLEIPAGIQSAIEYEAASRGIPAVGLWAQVPHYAATMAYPAAAAALLDGLSELAGVRFDPTPLRAAGIATRNRLDGLVAKEPDHERMVRELEKNYDREATAAGLPSGEELAAELERFLREEGEGGSGGPPGAG